MGKKAKQHYNIKLAKPHPEGSAIALLQTCVHEMGQISIILPNYWVFHYRSAKSNLKEIKKMQNEILYIKPDKSNFRLFSDMNLMSKFYDQGIQLITNTYLSFEHLTTLTLDKLFNVFQDKEIKKHEKDDLKEKLNFVLKYTNLNRLTKEQGYNLLFTEVERTRHNMNHPKRSTTFNCNESGWDNVPLAWLTAEKYKNIDQVFNLLEKLHQESENYFNNLPKDKITLTVERGIESLNHTQIKKRKIKYDRKHKN